MHIAVGRDEPSCNVETHVDGAGVPCVVVFNGGSSSIRFALHEAGLTLRRRLDGKIDRIGVSDATFIVNDPGGTSQASRPLEAQPIFASVTAAGHRVVHGMQHFEPEPVTPALLAELRRFTPYAPDHLPGEIALIEAFLRRHPRLPQVVCFDTAFHQTMPRVAKAGADSPTLRRAGRSTLRLPRFVVRDLMEELARLDDPAASTGRVILARLGNGASLTAVRDGHSIDTSMGFTPTAGLPMSTRSGDLDPGLVSYPT